MSTGGLLAQLFEVLAAIALAPLFMGWVNQCRAWLQNRSAPPLLQPYRTLHKLMRKELVMAEHASPLYRRTPYVLFGAMATAAAIVPSLGTDMPFASAADAIALVGLFATARVFIALGAMDIGTAFGSLGARREMMVGFLAEPALLMVIFTASLIVGSTALPTIAATLSARELALYPSLAFAGVAFLMVLLAENARIPIDNPATHLELTMIHEAMVLEYSGRHLALIEWAAALKLFNKDVVLAHNASSLFRAAPFIIFGCMVLACAIVPTLSTDLPFAPAADALALVGVFGLARIFIALAGMDVGTAFGSLGGRREMLVGFLAEPALLMVFFTLAMIAQSTSLVTIVETLAYRELVIYPSLAFAGVAFTFVSLAENARVPVDNPATHLELTMIHEAMILEYSGRHLALIEWAASLKLYAYSCLGLALFFPWGIAPGDNMLALVAAIPLLVLKLAIGGFLLAGIETVNAKLRIFRAPEFLGTAFMLAVLGLLVRLLLEVRV